MLRLLKSNTPLLVALNVILVIAFRVICLVEPIDVKALYMHSEPLSQWLFGMLVRNFNPVFLLVAGGVFNFLQSLMINNLVNDHKTTKRNYLAGLLFIVVSSFFKEFLYFSPVQISLFFLLIICDKIFRLTRPEKQLGEIFDMGFLSALATLFYFPSIIFLPLSLIGIYTMRPFSFRELWIVLFGASGIALAVFTWYFWYNELRNLPWEVTNFYSRAAIDFGKLSFWQIGAIAWMAFILIAGMLGVQGVLFASSIQIRKYTGFVTLSGIAMIVAGFLAWHFDWSHLELLALPTAFLLCLFFVESRDSIFLEVILAILFLSVPVLQYGSMLI